MVALLHLNGPPGIGKSTLAELYVARHPGTLDLDQDVVYQLVGGWQDPEQDTHALVRPVAKAMAQAYLAGGHDVVLPQYLGRLSEIEAFEGIALDQGAEFREVVLLDDRAASLARFDARQHPTAWNAHNRRMVESLGGPEFLDAMYDRLLAVLEHRPGAVVVRSEPGEVERTYAALLAALDEG